MVLLGAQQCGTTDFSGVLDEDFSVYLSKSGAN